MALALVIAVIVASTHSAVRAAAADPEAAAQAVLDARVAAVRSGDRAAFLATVDPQAPPAFRDAQGRWFDGMRSLPLASLALTVRTDDSGDLGRGLSARYGGAPVYLPETRLRYRFQDYDDRDDVQSLWLTYVERDGRWYVGGDTDLSALGLDTFRGLWDQGPVRVRPTAHFLVLSHPEDAARADALASIAEQAITVQTQRWDQPWSQRIPLILPHSVDELAILLQSTFDLDNFVAFVDYGALRDTDWTATAPRIYIQDRNLSRYPRDGQVETLVHELTHAAAAPLAGPFIPSWVHEGVADWVAKGRTTTERKPAGSQSELPRDYQFTTGGASAIVRAYGEARSAMSFLAAQRGLAAPGTLFRIIGADKVGPGNDDWHVDGALRQVAGVGLATFEKEWFER